MILQFSLYAFAGGLSGLFAGLFGIGGGLVAIPFLVFALPYAGFSQQVIMHVAVTTSLANIVVTSLVSIYSHHKRHAVQWEIIKRITLACLLGASFGALCAKNLPGQILQIIFSGFVFFIAYSLLTKKEPLVMTPCLPTGFKAQIPIFGISAFCSLLGMGGGSLMVPYFNYYHMPLRQAVGTASACGFFIACAGLAVLLMLTFHVHSPQSWMFGYLYWPAFLGMSLGSVLLTPLGAKLTHVLPVAILRRGFAIFLLFVGLSMVYKVIKP